MVKLRLKKLLEENQRTKYWLVKNLNGDYKTVDNMVENKSTGIKFDTIDKLCDIFNCEPGDLFEKIKE